MTFNRDAFVLVQHVTRSWGGQEQDRGGFRSVTVEDQQEESDSWPKIERFRGFYFLKIIKGIGDFLRRDFWKSLLFFFFVTRDCIILVNLIFYAKFRGHFFARERFLRFFKFFSFGRDAIFSPSFGIEFFIL